MKKKIEHIRNSHNVSLLLYHVVCVAKYRKSVFTKAIDELIREIAIEIEDRYNIWFLEIWTDNNHIHFLIQSVPKYSPKDIVQKMKSIIAKEIFKRNRDVKKWLRGWEFWTDWYYVNTVWIHWSADVIMKYVENQWNKDYSIVHKWKIRQLSLFD